jgi:hypothetical protein
MLLAAVAALAGLFVTGLYRDVAEGVRQARSTDLVTLAAVVPVLGFGLWRARSGSASARLVAIGALGYLAYSYAIYSFSVVINPLTPVHIAIFGLATWSLLLTVFGLDPAITDRASRLRVPRRAAGGFLLTAAALFAMLWLSQIAGTISTGNLPPGVAALNLPTSSVYALDLGFAIPLLTLSGWWLLHRNRLGPGSALAALSFIGLLGLSVLAIFAVDALAGITLELVPVVMFGLVSGLAVALAVPAIRPTGLVNSAPAPLAGVS